MASHLMTTLGLVKRHSTGQNGPAALTGRARSFRFDSGALFFAHLGKGQTVGTQDVAAEPLSSRKAEVRVLGVSHPRRPSITGSGSRWGYLEVSAPIGLSFVPAFARSFGGDLYSQGLKPEAKQGRTVPSSTVPPKEAPSVLSGYRAGADLVGANSPTRRKLHAKKWRSMSGGISVDDRGAWDYLKWTLN